MSAKNSNYYSLLLDINNLSILVDSQETGQISIFKR